MKRILFLIISLCMLICTTFRSGYTKTWVEDFNEIQLSSWKEFEDVDNRTTWQPKDGHLDVWVERIPRAFFQRHHLEFIRFPLHAEQLCVKVTILEVENAKAGIFIGQYTHDRNVIRRSYEFSQDFIWGPGEFPDQDPDVQYDIKNEIEIVFDKGHFELLSDGEHILKFDEPNLPHIDCLGLFVYMAEVPLGHVVLDDFIISGPSIPSNGKLDVQSYGKAAALWGELKR